MFRGFKSQNTSNAPHTEVAHMPVYPMRLSKVPVPVNCVHAPAIAGELHHGLAKFCAGKPVMLTGRVLLLLLLYWQTLCSGPGKLCAVLTTAASQANLRAKRSNRKVVCRQARAGTIFVACHCASHGRSKHTRRNAHHQTTAAAEACSDVTLCRYGSKRGLLSPTAFPRIENKMLIVR
jgi:hypothetical protein